uniref:F-box domain-containing protein n=1 Tax=Anopheles epiroticus TaxID=199890 RepID=A0A182PVC8_9DIPT
MEEVQHQRQSALRPSFPPQAVRKVHELGADGLPQDGSHSFGHDSGYTSYQSTTPNNTFNLSSRHGISSVTLATIDEANEIDCSMNESGSTGGGPGAEVHLTPKTAASMVLLSNIHLTTPKSTDRTKRTRRPIAFDYDGSSGNSSFLAPSTPDRLPGLSRSDSFEQPETPLRTRNRSASQPNSQLTPHKAKGAAGGGGGGSLKRKHSSFRGKLYSDGDDALPADENRPGDLNDSFDVDCRRLEDISPIPNAKRRKHQDRGIEDLMRSSTPKTASSQPTFLHVDTRATNDGPTGKRTFRKFQSFSPSKIQSTNVRNGRSLLRSNAFRSLERTPERKNEMRVLAEIHPPPRREGAVPEPPPPLDMATLLDAPILDDPSRQLATSVPSFDDFSLTPSKANLIDPELSVSSFVPEDYVSRHASNFSYAPMLNSILEESPVRGQPLLTGKLPPVPKTPPSITKSGRKLKRLGTNGGTGSSASSCVSSPARSVRSLYSRQSSRASVSPKARRLHPPPKSARAFSYCGFEYLNILHQLSEHNRDALEILLAYLDDTDLVQVVQVSPGWRSIIQSHEKSWKRLQRYLKQEKQAHRENKENRVGTRRANGSLTGPCVSLEAETNLSAELGEGTPNSETVEVPVLEPAAVPKRQPFKACNSLDGSHHASIGNASFAQRSFGNVTTGSDIVKRRASFAAGGSNVSGSVQHSPPVSPSMRKFVTNQKLSSTAAANGRWYSVWQRMSGSQEPMNPPKTARPGTDGKDLPMIGKGSDWALPIASHLKQSEQLRPCPRCEQPSRIIFSRSSKTHHGKSRTSARFSAVGARLEKSYTLPDPDTTASEHRNSAGYNTHSTSTVERMQSTDAMATAHRNNNEYHGQSPDRVRKNLFNSSNGTASATDTSLNVSSGLRRNSTTNTASSCSEQRMKLRSSAATKSFDGSSVVTPVADRDQLGLRDSKCDYAICSAMFCGFRFCIKCLCEYHPNTVCADLAANSPTKEEERSRSNVACSRQSRRSLQRLCRKL